MKPYLFIKINKKKKYTQNNPIIPSEKYDNNRSD